MSTTNGVCKKVIVKGDLVRKHEMRNLVDGEGRNFTCCIKCGSMPVKMQ